MVSRKSDPYTGTGIPSRPSETENVKLDAFFVIL